MSNLSIALIDTKVSNPNAYIVRAIWEALRRNPSISKVDLLDYESLNTSLQLYSYDILLAVDGEGLNTPVFQRAVQKVKKAALWVWEDPYERKINVEHSSLFDLVFTNDEDSLHAYPINGRFLPLAGSAEISVLNNESAFKHDIFFAGSAWPNRVLFLRRLLREMPELRTRIVLQYNPGVPRAFLDLPESDYVGSISHEEFLELANKSKVTITLHRAFSGDGDKRSAGSPGPRLFEVALAGGCQIVDNSVDVTGFFKSGEHVEIYSDFYDFKFKVLDLVNNASKRFRLAKESQAHARKFHTIQSRVETLLSEMACLPERAIISKELIKTRKDRLLFVTHNSVASGNFGGVEVYQDTLALQLRQSHEVMFFLPAHPPVRAGMREYLLTDDSYKVINSFLVHDFDMMKSLSHRELEEVFGLVLSSYNIDLIHFHHLINHSASLPLVAKMIGVPSVFTFQDFWTVCMKFNLIDHTGRYCDIDHRNKAACDVCLHATHKLHSGAQAYRREFFQHVLSAFNVILFNTPHTKQFFERLYPNIDISQSRVLGLPTPLSKARKKSKNGSTELDFNDVRRFLKVVFLGNFTAAKGANVFLNAIATMQYDNISFTVCGRVSEAYVKIIEEEGYKNINIMGGFDPGQLDLSEFDVALHLSIWPETYCITLSEAWQSGLVPVVSDCGALGDRVVHDVNGFKIGLADSGELVSILRRLTIREELERIRAKIAPHLWLTPEEHSAVIQTVYKQVRQSGTPTYVVDFDDLDGAGPTLDLTRLAPLPRDWTRPTAGPNIPSLYDDLNPLSPSWKYTKEIRSALTEGRIEVGHLRCCIDNFHKGVVPLDQWSTASANIKWGTERLSIRGWLLSGNGRADNIHLVLRSSNGDVVLIPYMIEERNDVTQTFGKIATGFETAPIILDMLDQGLYVLELMHIKPNNRIAKTPLPYAVSVTKEITCLSLMREGHQVDDGLIPTLPVPALYWTSPPTIDPSVPIEFVIDEFMIVNQAPRSMKDVFVLLINGWLHSAQKSVGTSPVLCITSSDTFVIPLAGVDRPDVRWAHGERIERDSGFFGSAFLPELNAGSHEVSLMFRTQHKAVKVVIGKIEVHDNQPSIKLFQ